MSDEVQKPLFEIAVALTAEKAVIETLQKIGTEKIGTDRQRKNFGPCLCASDLFARDFNSLDERIERFASACIGRFNKSESPIRRSKRKFLLRAYRGLPREAAGPFLAQRHNRISDARLSILYIFCFLYGGLG